MNDLKSLFLVVIALAYLPMVGQGQRPSADEKPDVSDKALITNTPAMDQSAAKKKPATSGELFDTIARLDSAMFDGYNAHDVDRMMSLFTDDLEFYHDTGGVSNYERTKESLKGLFARTPDIRRDLVKSSLEVYPIKDYGAIEIGEHRFCHKEDGTNGGPPRTDCGTFKFAMVWRKDGDSWKVARVISYGH